MKVIFASIFLFINSFCFAQNEIWNKLLVTEQARPQFSVTDMAIDQFNNKYILNVVENIVELKDKKIFTLKKYDEYEKLIWCKKLFEENNILIVPFSFEVDRRGNIYLGVNFKEQIKFKSVEFMSNGDGDGLLIKLDRNGDLLFTKQFGGNCNDGVNNIAVDDQDNIYLGGQFGSNRFDIDLDCSIVINDEVFETDKNSNSDYYLMKLDKFGEIIWVQTGGGWSFDALHNIAVEGDEVYFSGFSSSISHIQLNNYELFVPKRVSIYSFLAKADAITGEVIWASYAGNSGALNYVDPKSLRATKYGVSILGVINTGDPGQSNRLFIKNSEPLVWEGIADPEYFLINYDTAGNVNWAKKGLHLGRDNVEGLVIDNKDNHYIAGYSSGGFVFNNDTIFSQGGNDIFVACYNANGEEQWIKTAGGKGNDTANSIALDRSGRIYVCGGTSSNPVTFGDITVEPPHPNNVFLARLSDDPILSILPINNNQTATAVYPNPATNRLWLQQNAGQQNIVSLLLYNIKGNLVQQNFKNTNNGFDVSQLSTGVYLLNITYSNGAQEVVKWCKQ